MILSAQHKSTWTSSDFLIKLSVPLFLVQLVLRNLLSVNVMIMIVLQVMLFVQISIWTLTINLKVLALYSLKQLQKQ